MQCLIIKAQHHTQWAKKYLNKFQYALFKARTVPVFLQVRKMLEKSAKNCKDKGETVKVKKERRVITVMLWGEPDYIKWQSDLLHSFLYSDASKLKEEYDKDGRLIQVIKRLYGKTGAVTKGKAYEFLNNCGIYITSEVIKIK